MLLPFSVFLSSLKSWNNQGKHTLSCTFLNTLLLKPKIMNFFLNYLVTEDHSNKKLVLMEFTSKKPFLHLQNCSVSFHLSREHFNNIKQVKLQSSETHLFEEMFFLQKIRKAWLNKKYVRLKRKFLQKSLRPLFSFQKIRKRNSRMVQ